MSSEAGRSYGFWPTGAIGSRPATSEFGIPYKSVVSVSFPVDFERFSLYCRVTAASIRATGRRPACLESANVGRLLLYGCLWRRPYMRPRAAWMVVLAIAAVLTASPAIAQITQG